MPKSFSPFSRIRKQDPGQRASQLGKWLPLVANKFEVEFVDALLVPEPFGISEVSFESL